MGICNLNHIMISVCDSKKLNVECDGVLIWSVIMCYVECDGVFMWSVMMCNWSVLVCMWSVMLCI